MNKRPILYMQTDSRWTSKPYYSTGDYNTIGKSGCGPTSAAMLVATLKDPSVTPVEACAWSVAHGYRTKDQGTAYGLFVPYFAAYDISCQQLNWSNIYGGANGAASVHAKAFELLKQGYYLIAVMGAGTWTSSGHFIVVWWEDGKVRINDPASTKDARVNGDLDTFKAQVKYYWAIDAREYNKDELGDAVDKLVKAGVINSPDYWKQGKDYSDANVVSLITKAASLCDVDELALACCKLATAGIIDSPSYWDRGKGYTDANVVTLIKKLATLC